MSGKPFPKQMKSKKTNKIVEFTSIGVGKVVRQADSISQHKIGYYSDTWNMNYFIDIDKKDYVKGEKDMSAKAVKPFPKLVFYKNINKSDYLINGKQRALIVYKLSDKKGIMLESKPSDSRPMGSIQNDLSRYGWEDYDGIVTEEHIKLMEANGVDCSEWKTKKKKTKGEMNMCEKSENVNNWEFKLSHPLMIDYNTVRDELSYDKPIGLIYIKTKVEVPCEVLDENKKLVESTRIEDKINTVAVLHQSIIQKAKLSGIELDYSDFNRLESRREITKINNWVRKVKNAKYIERNDCEVEVRLIEIG